MTDKIRILAIGGSTASGKSALAMELAHRYGGEIISCDSMQVYKQMNIGTAKPTDEDMKKIRHHMIDIVEPDSPFSCADYVRLASAAIEDVARRGGLPIVCGGTGLYLDALLRGSDFSEDSDPDPTLRKELLDFAEKNGKEALYEELRRIDPESAAETHPNNVKRVARAIEIYRTSGKTKTELDRLSRLAPKKYDATVIALRYNDRDILKERINKRVDIMIAEGLERETRELLALGIFEKNTTAAQAIGYKEFLGYFRGESSFDECVELLKTATRKYAKRQITWFGGKDYVRQLDADENGKMKGFEEIVKSASEMFFDKKC